MVSTILWGLILENCPKSILEEIEQCWKSETKTDYVFLDYEIFLLLLTTYCSHFNVFVFGSSTIAMSPNMVPKIQGAL